jgi:hypothetical protein
VVDETLVVVVVQVHRAVVEVV